MRSDSLVFLVRFLYVYVVEESGLTTRLAQQQHFAITPTLCWSAQYTAQGNARMNAEGRIDGVNANCGHSAIAYTAFPLSKMYKLTTV